jgi:site-specific DNA-methyltransferase (adenine-specific)
MLNKIILGDSRDSSNYQVDFHLTITSPPYFVGKEYEKDYTFADYKDLLKSVFHNTANHTVDGGKIAINICDIAAFSKVSGRVEENIEVSRDLVDWLKKDDCHLLSRIAWIKDSPWINSQHVSYNKKVPATYIRMLPSWEYIWVFYKGDTPTRKGVPPVTKVVSKEDWKKWATGVWYMRSVPANKDHPAMFPQELARRLVLLYSIKGDTVFDPFMGSGTTAVVAYQNNRNYAGIERDPEYYALAVESLRGVENSLYRDLEYVPPVEYKQERLF